MGGKKAKAEHPSPFRPARPAAQFQQTAIHKQRWVNHHMQAGKLRYPERVGGFAMDGGLTDGVDDLGSGLTA